MAQKVTATARQLLIELEAINREPNQFVREQLYREFGKKLFVNYARPKPQQPGEEE